MYLFNFSKFALGDKIFKLSNNIFSKKIKSWDWVKCGDDFFLVIWNEISFAEKYSYEYQPKNNFDVVFKWLLSAKNIQLINWMVYNYYSNYKSVMKYFLSDDIDSLIKKFKTQKLDQKTTKKSILWKFVLAQEGQTLIVFPDIWTLYNTIDSSYFEIKNITILLSSDTQNQKDKKRWSIKNWESEIIISTHWEIFQDFKNLQKIIQVDPFKWYYANQQDPRYKTNEVLQKISEIHNCKLDVFSL
jgi:primosomal protein N'